MSGLLSPLLLYLGLGQDMAQAMRAFNEAFKAKVEGGG